MFSFTCVAFRGDADTEAASDTPDTSPAALETPMREFQVFQIRDPEPPTLRSFAITRDVGGVGGDAGDDAGGVMAPDAEGVDDDQMIVEPVDNEATDELPVLDPLTVDRLRNVRIELQPDDPIRVPDDAVADELRTMDLVYPDGPDDGEGSPRDDE